MRVFLFCLAFLVSVSASAGWQSRDSNYDKNVVSSAGYSGPGDVVSGFAVWISCARAYNAAYAAGTGNLCKVVDSATGLTNCTITSTAAGFANLTATACPGSTTIATFCVSGCKVNIAYDQSGALFCSGSTACNWTQATLANMPTLLLSALNGLPCIASAAGGGLMASPTFTQAQPFTFSAVAERTGAFTTLAQIIGGVSSDPSLLFRNLANSIAMYAGSVVGPSGTAADSAFHAVQAAFNGASSTMNIDGSSSGTIPGTDGISTGVGMGNGGFNLTGTVCEAGMVAINASSGQQTNLNANQHSATNGYNF